MYQEEITFFGKVFYYVLVLLIVFVIWLGEAYTFVQATPVIVLAVILPLLFGRFLITVNNKTINVSYGYLGLIHKEISLADVQEARVVEYNGLRHFCGWGIRSGKFEGEKTACYTMKGNKGVLLKLNRDMKVCFTKTNKLLIGSLTPEKFRSSLGK
jgi:hypothetical protein